MCPRLRWHEPWQMTEREPQKLHCPKQKGDNPTVLWANDHITSLSQNPGGWPRWGKDNEILAHLPRMERWEQTLVV